MAKKKIHEVIEFPDGHEVETGLDVDGSAVKDTIVSLGRNGITLTDGIVVSALHTLRMIEIAPLTSKGRVGRCYVRFPRDERVLRKLIDFLQVQLLDIEADKLARGTLDNQRKEE